MNYNEKRDHFISPILEWAKANAPQQNVANSLIMAVGDAKSNCERLKDGEPFKVPSQFNGKDYITMLLQIDAEIEQGLMLQYLYSAYSMEEQMFRKNIRKKCIRGKILFWV